MLVSVRVIPAYPGLGLKLGSRRGIATDFISGRGDEVRLEAPDGGAEHSVPAALPGRLVAFRGSMTCGYGRALNERGQALLLEYPCGGACVSGQPVEVFFGEGFG
jgi:hypothetical protein